jgi:DNA-binding CsgD family transcriptional regulator
MKRKGNIIKDYPVEFQVELINLVRNLIGSSAVRFWLINPKIDFKGFVSYNVDKQTEEVYQKKYSCIDPIHPSRFEDTDITVICSDTLMSDNEWRNSDFYREFMAPRHYDHDTDMFFRCDRKITAVLSILRDDRLGPFTEEELELLRHLQPFLEYTLNCVYRPKRFTERKYLTDKYSLTDRELDVVEIVMAGVDTKTIAYELNLSTATVKTHLLHIFEKVGVHTAKELIATFYRELSH